MKPYATALLVALAAFAGADRHALLIGIDSYPIVQGRQLSGAAYDLRLMKAMMDSYGFQTVQIAGAQATRESVIRQMALLERDVKPGDEYVFYFSGRGSIAPPASDPKAKVGLEPTLVPYDGKADSTDYDLPMSRLETWAASITKSGGEVTIIVDASFESPTRDDVGRPYNPVPRMIRRKATLDGEVRSEPYLGPGIYLAATPTEGSAYEYLVNASKNTWAGAFTDMLVNEVIGELHKGQSPTYSGVMREVEAYFKDKVRQDYMPGLAPYPFVKTLVDKADVYDKPMFGGVNPSMIPPAQKAQIAQIDADKQKQQSKLRIGLSFPAVRGRTAQPVAPRGLDDMQKDRDPKLVDAMTKYVAANLHYAEVEPVGAPIDVIVTLVRQPGGTGIDARIAGDEVDAAQGLSFSGNSVDGIMAAGLADQLERKSLTIRLFRTLENGKPSWEDASASLQSDKDSYAPNETVKLAFKCGGPALLYVFDRDDADGIVQITYPTVTATDNLLTNENGPPSPFIDPNSPTGKMLVRALFVQPSDDLKLPQIPKDADMKTVLTGLLKQLRILVPAIESGRAKWATADLTVEIKQP